MKKRLLSLALALGSITAIAQIPVLTSSSNPVIGDRFPFYFTDTFNPGAAGTAMTWNFNTLHQYGSDTLVFTSCASTVHCSDFPGATISGYVVSSPTTPNYYNISATALSNLGGYSTVPIYYSNYQDISRYPFTYGDSYIDTFSSIFTSSGYTYHRVGTITVTADAYGTLVLPYGTFLNVLRIKTTELFDDTTMITPPTIWHYRTDIYTWYAPDYHMELLNQYTQYRNSTVTSKYSYYSIQNPTSVNELSAQKTQVQLYPIPANDKCVLKCNAGFERGAYVDLMGIDGRVVGKYALQGTETVIPIALLSAGLYTCRIYNGGLQLEKLVIAR
jgi:hypothetical protein